MNVKFVVKALHLEIRHVYATERHIRTVHQKLKPYKCEQCDKSFGERK